MAHAVQVLPDVTVSLSQLMLLGVTYVKTRLIKLACDVVQENEKQSSFSQYGIV